MLPPLVTSWEILALKQQVAEAQEGKRFLLQGGDCAESFADCESGLISNRLKVLLQMSLVLVHGLRLPVVRVGRFAGQYAKPRSADIETRGDVTLPSYRGDFVNQPEFTVEARTPDPRAHGQGPRALGDDDELRARADRRRLRRPAPPRILGPGLGRSTRRCRDEYHRMVAAVGDAVRFMETISRRGAAQPQPRRLLHLARSAAAALRGGADAAGAAAVGLVQPQHALPVDRHAHGGARRRARRVLPRHPQPDRGEDRAVGDAGPAAAPGRRAQPATTSPAA